MSGTKKTAGETIRKEIKPETIESFNKVQTLIARVRRKEAIIVDFDGVPAATAKRLLDYLSGAMFALNGAVNRLEEKQYILIPKGVKVTERTE